MAYRRLLRRTVAGHRPFGRQPVTAAVTRVIRTAAAAAAAVMWYRIPGRVAAGRLMVPVTGRVPVARRVRVAAGIRLLLVTERGSRPVTCKMARTRSMRLCCVGRGERQRCNDLRVRSC